jgi:hypothetical protein
VRHGRIFRVLVRGPCVGYTSDRESHVHYAFAGPRFLSKLMPSKIFVHVVSSSSIESVFEIGDEWRSRAKRRGEVR